jgi:archaellum component FlaC
MIEGEPSALGRSQRGDSGQEEELQEDREATSGHEAAEQQGLGSEEIDTGGSEHAPAAVRDQLDRLGGQIRGLQQQVEELAARRSDAVAEQASQRVAAIVQAAEESAAEISTQAHVEAAELRERLRSEAQADADRIRVEAQADASKIRTEAHAAAARLREETLAEVREAVERITERLSEELRTSARAAIDEVAGSESSAAHIEPAGEPEPTVAIEPEEVAPADVEGAVDELQSAAAVLEESLRHLQEIGQGLPDSQ